jgi:ribosome recycling factor
LEEAKVSIRKERDAVWQNIQEKEKGGGMSEDDKFRFKNEMEKHTQEAIKKMEELVSRKEKEIMS